MLDVVTFKWDTPGYRSKFDASHVHTLVNMVRRNYHKPFRFTCITDDPTGINRDKVRVLPMWDTFADLASPHRGNNPACYRRLALWAPDAAEVIGPRILCIDLDMVICSDVSPLWDRPEDVVLWADNLNKTTPYNGAMQLIRAGSRPRVFETFDPKTSPALTLKNGLFGTDQAWISYVLGPNEARWTAADGALSWRVHCRNNKRGNPPHCAPLLPDAARVVNFHGNEDPWALAPRVPWIAEHYR